MGRALLQKFVNGQLDVYGMDTLVVVYNKPANFEPWLRERARILNDYENLDEQIAYYNAKYNEPKQKK